jgi:hypothetical protein
VIEKTGWDSARTASAAAGMPPGCRRAREAPRAGSRRGARADLVAEAPQRVAHLRPQALEPVGVDVLARHLDEEMRAAAQVEAEVDQPRRQPASGQSPASGPAGWPVRSARSRASFARSTRS